MDGKRGCSVTTRRRDPITAFLRKQGASYAIVKANGLRRSLVENWERVGWDS